jgi:hypothetical protein
MHFERARESPVTSKLLQSFPATVEMIMEEAAK